MTLEPITQVAKEIHNKGNMIILGKGLGGVIAKEASLKMKEIPYLFAIPYNSAEFKHGTLALLNPDVNNPTPVVMLIFNDENFQ